MNVHIKSILSALAFSLLFYSKSIGLNLFLISIIVVVLLTTLKKEQLIFWGYSALYLYTAILVFINPSGFTYFVHIVAFFVLIGKSISQKISLYLSCFIGLINMVVALISKINGHINHPNEKKKDISPKAFNYIKGGVIALFLLLIFTLLYKNANPVFNDLLTQIDLSFISIPWLFFTFLGYLMSLHLLLPFSPKQLIEYDQALDNTLIAPKEPFLPNVTEKLNGENTLGSIVFTVLNLLLIFFLVTDAIYLFQENNISNAEYSQSVHQGVYALMFSIIIAIFLILYFFRGKLNFFEENKGIKSLTYAWIGLNIILVAFTSYKNFTYVEALGLTYKRIGVFVYLLLTLTGLITAYIKVAQIKSFVYLVRTNLATLFAFLIVSASIPWDSMITWYNLKEIEVVDLDYLINLGDSNSTQLSEYAKNNNPKLPIDLLKRIDQKNQDFLRKQSDKSWQEYTLYQFTTNNKK
ncbi:MAG: hypothetical protein COA50_07315 [Flavobacteriaceae bacterium]|nr:MAG: hypothetical protein COA50_07315 [Flavobacteriaceae bacterium]